jgi:hypothetical protein
MRIIRGPLFSRAKIYEILRPELINLHEIYSGSARFFNEVRRELSINLNSELDIMVIRLLLDEKKR